jgi:hypothetical protein
MAENNQMTRIAKGEQLKVLREVLSRLGTSTLHEIYTECRKHPEFADLNAPDARIRTLLQRNCTTAKQFRTFPGGSDLFVQPSPGLWGLKVSSASLRDGERSRAELDAELPSSAFEQKAA